MSQNPKQDKMDANKQRSGSTSAGAATNTTGENRSESSAGGLRNGPVWTPPLARPSRFEVAVAALRSYLPTYETGASQYQQLKGLLQSTPEPLRTHIQTTSAFLEASNTPYNSERAGMPDVLRHSDAIIQAMKDIWSNLSHFHGEPLRTYMAQYPQGSLTVVSAQAAQTAMLTELVPYLDQARTQAAGVVQLLRDMGDAITPLGVLLGLPSVGTPHNMLQASALYQNAKDYALGVREVVTSAHGHCAQFGAITPAVPSTFDNLFTDIAKAAEQVPGDRPYSTAGVVVMLKKLDETDQALANAIREYADQLQRELKRYLEGVSLYTERARYWPAHPKLSFRFRSLTCLDTQDPTSQDKVDDMYIAWITIDPQGHVLQGIKPLGRFQHQGKHGGLIKLDKDEPLHTFETWRGAAFPGELYMVYVALIERDGELEAEKEWNRIALELGKAMLTGLGPVADEKTTCAWLDANRARFDFSLKNTVFNWNDDDMLGTRLYEVRTGQSGNGLFSPTPSERLDTFEYQNKPKDKTVKVGKYRLTTAWRYQS